MSTEIIKITYKEAIVMLPSLEKVASNDKMPTFLNWRFSKPFSVLKTELGHLDEARKKLIFRYCKKDEAGEPIRLQGANYQFEPEEFVKYEKEFETLLNEEFEISIKKSTIDELAPYQMSLINLEKFIIDEDGEEKK